MNSKLKRRLLLAAHTTNERRYGMRKLRAVWQILFADKWAVFTFEEAPNDPEWLTAPYFRWNISHKFKEDENFYQLIKNKISHIENYEEHESNNN